MKINSDYLAPCGLYCGVCAVLYASRDNDQKFQERLVGVYKGKLPRSDNLKPEDIQCKGCLSDETFGYCSRRAIRACARKKGYAGCHECQDFPCRLIKNFPIEVGTKVMLRAVPYWREVGTEKFVQDEEARYACPECGHKLFRGAMRCNKCKTAVELD